MGLHHFSSCVPVSFEKMDSSYEEGVSSIEPTMMLWLFYIPSQTPFRASIRGDPGALHCAQRKLVIEGTLQVLL